MVEKEAHLMADPNKSWFVVLVEQDSDYSGSDTWWKKGEYQADRADLAVEMAFADTYLAKDHKGSARRREHVAVVGPGAPWVEFTVELESQPASVVVIHHD